MDNRIVTQRGRERAAGEARNLHLGRTMERIQDGAPDTEVWAVAVSEYARIHERCPCCGGSQTNAELIANHIVNLMKDFRLDPSQAHC